MKKGLILLTALLLSAGSLLAQSEFYTLNRQASEAYSGKHYQQSGELYERAFRQKQAQPSNSDFYNAACSWALAGNADKAFLYLDRATTTGWDNLPHLKQDTDLTSLHADKRWEPMLRKLETTLAKAEASYNKPLKQQLDSIYASDQGMRQGYNELNSKYGPNSPEMAAFWKRMQEADARNLAAVTALLDKHGWPTRAEVGRMGNTTVFLVIQHSNLATMEKYFPMAQQALARGDLAKPNFALLQDRLLMWQGKPQIYGSQLTSGPDGKMKLHPIEDEAHVDERRAAIGMEPIASYVKRFGVEYTGPAKNK